MAKAKKARKRAARRRWTLVHIRELKCRGGTRWSFKEIILNSTGEINEINIRQWPSSEASGVRRLEKPQTVHQSPWSHSLPLKRFDPPMGQYRFLSSFIVILFLTATAIASDDLPKKGSSPWSLPLCFFLPNSFISNLIRFQRLWNLLSSDLGHCFERLTSSLFTQFSLIICILS